MAYADCLPSALQIQESCFPLLRLHVERHLRDMDFLAKNMDFKVLANEMMRSMVLDLRTYVLSGREQIEETRKTGRIDVEEKWPDGWWQAFKERWFPHWAQRRWPVRYRTISIHEDLRTEVHKSLRVCPHLNVKAPSGHAMHFRWLEGEGDGFLRSGR